MPATYVTRTICKIHNFTAMVGNNVTFALDYYECPACVAISDREYAESMRPCCSRAHIDCCGHGEYDEDVTPPTADELLMIKLLDRPRYIWEDVYGGLQIKSSNYCNGPVPF